jgi:hypothetical protein
LSVPSARHYAIGVCRGGPLRDEIEQRDPHALDRATDAVSRALELRFGTGAYTAAAQALLVTAG